MKKNKIGLALLTLVAVMLLAGSAVSAKTSDAGLIQHAGKVGKYNITVDVKRQTNTLYVTKGKKKTKIDSGDIGMTAVVASEKLFYTKGVKLYRCSMTGKNKKVIDRECASNNDPAIKIVAYAKECVYYSKPADKTFHKMKVYRYHIANGKKEICDKRNFSYEYCMNIYKGYKYSYDEPTELAGKYNLYVSRLADNGTTLFASGVYTHKFFGDKVYYMTADLKKGVVQYVKADLNGKQKEVIASFDYMQNLKENNHIEDGVDVAPQKLTADKAEFIAFYMDKNNSEKKVVFSVDFKTGETKRK